MHGEIPYERSGAPPLRKVKLLAFFSLEILRNLFLPFLCFGFLVLVFNIRYIDTFCVFFFLIAEDSTKVCWGGGGGDEPRQPLRDQNALARLYIVLSFLGAGRETVKICTGNGIKIKINDPSQLAPVKAGSRDAGCGMRDGG